MDFLFVIVVGAAGLASGGLRLWMHYDQRVRAWYRRLWLLLVLLLIAYMVGSAVTS